MNAYLFGDAGKQNNPETRRKSSNSSNTDKLKKVKQNESKTVISKSAVLSSKTSSNIEDSKNKSVTPCRKGEKINLKRKNGKLDSEEKKFHIAHKNVIQSEQHSHVSEDVSKVRKNESEKKVQDVEIEDEPRKKKQKKISLKSPLAAYVASAEVESLQRKKELEASDS